MPILGPPFPLLDPEGQFSGKSRGVRSFGICVLKFSMHLGTSAECECSKTSLQAERLAKASVIKGVLLKGQTQTNPNERKHMNTGKRRFQAL